MVDGGRVSAAVFTQGPLRCAEMNGYAGETHAALPRYSSRARTKLLIIFFLGRNHIYRSCVPLLLRFHPDIAQKRVYTNDSSTNNKSKPENAAKNNAVHSA
jgi:hypothetical protein